MLLINLTPFSDDSWDDNDAKVVCRMLGFNETFARAFIKSVFGRVEDNFIMDDVKCVGTEESLEDCPHSSEDNCDEKEGAGVICYGKMIFQDY